MPPALSDEEYASSEDSDFAPEQIQETQPDSSASSSESEAEVEKADAPAARSKPVKRKRAVRNQEEAEDAGFENSGDEAIIQKARKRRRRRKDGDAAEGAVLAEEDEGGEGGLIKTRSQRKAEKSERKAQVAKGPVTIDVDAVWAEMLSGPAVPTSQPERDELQVEEEGEGQDGTLKEDRPPVQPVEKTAAPSTGGTIDEEMILIKRKYNFAGKIHTESKLVPRSSAEAKLYLSSLSDPSNPDASLPPSAEDSTPPRQIRRAYRSKFEPPVHILGRTDLNLLMASTLQSRSEREAKDKAKKLNTVEKSRMDWAGYVDKEGLKDELELAGRSKGSFAERERFLAQSDGRREEEARRARVAGKV